MNFNKDHFGIFKLPVAPTVWPVLIFQLFSCKLQVVSCNFYTVGPIWLKFGVQAPFGQALKPMHSNFGRYS